MSPGLAPDRIFYIRCIFAVVLYIWSVTLLKIVLHWLVSIQARKVRNDIPLALHDKISSGIGTA